MELICNAFKRVICRGGYNLEGMLEKIDTYHIEGKLTDAERDELRQVAIDCADIVNHPEYSELVERVKISLGISQTEIEEGDDGD